MFEQLLAAAMTGQREILLQTGAQRILQGKLRKTLCCIFTIIIGIVGIATLYNYTYVSMVIYRAAV